VVNRVRSTSARRRRVYTIRTASLLALLALLTVGAGVQTPVDLSVEPTMVKGPDSAAVVIVEFSDYQ
jgi:hypothetical protein